MNEASADLKAELRREIRTRLKSLPAARHSELSAKLVAQFQRQRMWNQAKSVLLFSPIAGEPEISPLIREAVNAGKRIALPFFDASTQSYSARFIRDAAADLAVGEFGILEPRSSCELAPLNRLDLVLVPGVAFDALGRRLGRGRGFYDRMLAQVSGTTCGVAFDEQIVEAVPIEPHDVQLNCILTPTRLIET